MTKAEAIDYFMTWAIETAMVEALSDENEDEETAATYHKLHTHYENCVRWLLGLPRLFGEDNSRDWDSGWPPR